MCFLHVTAGMSVGIFLAIDSVFFYDHEQVHKQGEE